MTTIIVLPTPRQEATPTRHQPGETAPMADFASLLEAASAASTAASTLAVVAGAGSGTTATGPADGAAGDLVQDAQGDVVPDAAGAVVAEVVATVGDGLVDLLETGAEAGPGTVDAPEAGPDPAAGEGLAEVVSILERRAAPSATEAPAVQAGALVTPAVGGAEPGLVPTGRPEPVRGTGTHGGRAPLAGPDAPAHASVHGPVDVRAASVAGAGVPAAQSPETVSTPATAVRADPSATVTTAAAVPTPGAAAPSAVPAPGPDPAAADRAVTAPSADASTKMDAAVAGAVSHRTVAVAPPAVAPPAAAAPALAPQVADQLRVRVPALRAAGPGEYVLTLRVEPESIGPVRVVAHIGADGVRVELLGATDTARDALRAALPDLRRDLVGTGLTADLGSGRGDLADGRGRAGSGGAADQAGADGGRDRDRPGAGDDLGREPARDPTGDTVPRSEPDGRRTAQSRTRLDLFV